MAEPSPSGTGEPPEPVLPPGYEVPARELLGCAVAYTLIAIEIIGLPVGIVFGLLTGEWRWLIPWAIVVLVVFVLGRLNLIPIFGD